MKLARTQTLTAAAKQILKLAAAAGVDGDRLVQMQQLTKLTRRYAAMAKRASDTEQQQAWLGKCDETAQQIADLYNKYR